MVEVIRLQECREEAERDGMNWPAGALTALPYETKAESLQPFVDALLWLDQIAAENPGS